MLPPLYTASHCVMVLHLFVPTPANSRDRCLHTAIVALSPANTFLALAACGQLTLRVTLDKAIWSSPSSGLGLDQVSTCKKFRNAKPPSTPTAF